MLDFSINLPASMERLMELSQDFENLPKYLPDQLKSVKILEQKDNETKTEETIVFSTVIRKEIIQEAIHKKKDGNELVTEIISGPAKGTRIDTKFSKTFYRHYKIFIRFKFFNFSHLVFDYPFLDM